MPHARFAVDPRLAAVLGESYRSSEDAVKELVDNAWDADAETVKITLPEAMTNDPIVVEDNGYGMTPQEVQQDYLRVARDRRAKRGTHTTRGRLVKGRRGIGKFAGLMVAGEMVVDTRATGQRTTLVIRSDDLVRDDTRDLERIDLPREIVACDKGDHGTTVTLTQLHQNLTFPSSKKLRQILVMEYGRAQEFAVFVNGERLGVRDAPGEMFEKRKDLGLEQPVDLTFKIMDHCRPAISRTESTG
jgi:HSP90 family molecular chaperone